jgi:MFS family permease
MTTRWWFSFAGMEQVAFKPTAEGFIYRAPNPWLFGPGRYYLVNQAQKSELARDHRRMLLVLFWMIVAGGAIAGPLAGGFAPGPAWATLAFAMLIGLAIGFAANLWLVAKVSPIVAGLPLSSERITQADTFKRQMNVYSPRFILGYGVLSLVLLALSVWDGMYGPTGWNLYPVVGAVLFGATTIYWAVLFVAQRRRPIDAGEQTAC